MPLYVLFLTSLSQHTRRSSIAMCRATQAHTCRQMCQFCMFLHLMLKPASSSFFLSSGAVKYLGHICQKPSEQVTFVTAYYCYKYHLSTNLLLSSIQEYFHVIYHQIKLFIFKREYFLEFEHSLSLAVISSLQVPFDCFFPSRHHFYHYELIQKITKNVIHYLL